MVPGSAGWLWEAGASEPPTNKPICPECGKIYSNNSNLKQHIANVHASTLSWELCQVCGKRFKTKQYLQVHLLATHGIRQRKSYNPFYQGEVSQNWTERKVVHGPFSLLVGHWKCIFDITVNYWREEEIKHGIFEFLRNRHKKLNTF